MSVCDYQGYEFGAGFYPDSICIDGQLFDADNCDDQGDLYEPAEYIPWIVGNSMLLIKSKQKRGLRAGAKLI
jgi:hypothetical protein